MNEGGLWVILFYFRYGLALILTRSPFLGIIEQKLYLGRIKVKKTLFKRCILQKMQI
jgi:hypothetical protein